MSRHSSNLFLAPSSYAEPTNSPEEILFLDDGDKRQTIRKTPSSTALRLSRSHYSSRTDSDTGTDYQNSIPTRTAAEVRQQTVSFTFRDLSMTSSQSRWDLPHNLTDESSPNFNLPEKNSLPPKFSSAITNTVNSASLDIKKAPLVDQELTIYNNFETSSISSSAPRKRQVSQISAMRQKMSISKAPDADNLKQKLNLETSLAVGISVEDETSINVISPASVERSKSASSSSNFEETPLISNTASLGKNSQYTEFGTLESTQSIRKPSKKESNVRTDINSSLIKEIAFNGLKSIPAVILGLILNVLDAMSYGIIVFPQSAGIVETATQSGISMFLSSTIIAQLVYTFGGSKFKGANGSMMIEVMPFLHIMCRIIEDHIGAQNQREVMATIMVTFSLSTILTGIVFLLLGIFKLGNVIQFFPRHILVGCIGGIGLFLLETGIEVSTGLKTEFTFSYLYEIFAWQRLQIWGTGLLLALSLKFLQRFISHPLFVPSFYMIVPLVFYIIVWATGSSLEDLRKQRWLFDLPSSEDVPFYTYWTYFDFESTVWSAIPATLPTMFALTFFGILHVPINVPALAVSTHQEVDTNLEIVGHGISNIASGLIGSVQNYLVYANSLLYIRSGGNTRIGGFLLALATSAVWIFGGSVVSLVPTVVVASLIFLLGIDLLMESLVDTLHVGINMVE
ncbi:hypothetical protein HK096_002460 [Nowakowskiella sp. JEL0078]|nr:hypothetical protein HK096_002460 [Nowakowskiella sp. JEL0078]